MEMKHIGVGVGLTKDVLEARVVVTGGATFDAVHLVAHRQEQLNQVAAILAGDAAYKSDTPLGTFRDAWGSRRE